MAHITPFRVSTSDCVKAFECSFARADQTLLAVASHDIYPCKNSPWDPSSDKIDLVFKCKICGIKSLFGDDAIVSPSAKVEISMFWASKESRQRGVIFPVDQHGITHRALGVFTSDSNDEIHMTFHPRFADAQFRGNINLWLGLSLADPGEGGPWYQAKTPGSMIGSVCDSEYRIIVDGNGSLFPIVFECLGQDGVIWKLDLFSNDPSSDSFDETNVRLVINKDREDFSKYDPAIGITSSYAEVLSSWILSLYMEIMHQHPDQAPLIHATSENTITSENRTIIDFLRYFFGSNGIGAGSPNAIFLNIRESITRILSKNQHG